MLDSADAMPAPGRNANVDRYRWLMPAASAGGMLLLAVLIMLVAWRVNQGDGLADLLHLGYPGASIVMFFSSATVFLPAPGLAVVFGAGSLGEFNPLLLGIFAGVGSSIGELTGYLVGIGGRQALHPSRNRFIKRCEFFMRRWGFLTILCMASIPNPAFDAVGIVAGSLGYSARRLWVACVLGNSLKYTAVALLGGTASGLFFQD